MKAIVAPSILAADFANLGRECHQVIASKVVSWLHLDIMDGHFVPNLSFGPPLIESLRRVPELANIYFDVHLMIDRPADWIEVYAKAGANGLTFHYEAMQGDLDAIVKLCRRIRDLKISVGVAIKPSTKCEALFPLLDGKEKLIDMVLVMTVEPGFGGQKFQPAMMEKVCILRSRYPQLDIEVDGGINEATSTEAVANGANVLVAGSAIFNAADPQQACRNIKSILDRHLTLAANDSIDNDRV